MAALRNIMRDTRHLHVGKIVGGGFALAAAPDAPTSWPSSTAPRPPMRTSCSGRQLSGNPWLPWPVSHAGGAAPAGTYEQVFRTGRELWRTVGAARDRRPQGAGDRRAALFDLVFTDRPIRDYRDTLHGDAATFEALQSAAARHAAS